MKLESFEFILRGSVDPSDQEWSFSVPSLPKSATISSSGLVKSINVISNVSKRQIVLRLIKAANNRVIKAEPLDSFVSISFADFRLRHQTVDPTAESENQSTSVPATQKESADYVVRLLQSGVAINGVQYNFYGHSNSQLKSRTCFLLAVSKEEVSRRVEGFGDFSKMKSVAKKAKRIGLLFSAAEIACDVQPDHCEDIADVVKDDYIFTDGCGLISQHFAKTLVQKRNILFRNQRYTPSVFQLRYRGYKGVVMTDPSMKGKIKLRLRESMRKFKGGDDWSFSVVAYSKPYAFGFLNDQIVLLLHCLSIPETMFLRKQREYFEFLSAASTDPRAAFRFLMYVDAIDLAERVLLEGFEPFQRQISSLISQEFSKMTNARGVQKCRIMIPRSRLLFGVCDPTGVLREGECAVKVTLDEDGQPRPLNGMEILVTRNPCLHPGDLQKFKVVARPELAHLVDCIVFSVKGRRPSADMMSGGDLDGDKFLVCWDSDLVPPKLSEPARYQGAKEPLKFGPITDDDRLQYFARYNNASLGRVNNLFLDWARAKGPMSVECQELNHLFSQSVDGNRIKVPKHLETPPTATTPFILDTLHESATQYLSSQSHRLEWNGYSFDAIQLLLSRGDVALSEFELVKLTHRWCVHNHSHLAYFTEYFDFNQLNDDEKAWTLGQLPPSTEAASMVLNALSCSNLVTEQELRPFRLQDSRLHWKCAFDSSQDRMGMFLETTSRLLSDFHKKVIVLQVDARLTLAIYVPKKIEKARDCCVDDTVRLFAFPHTHVEQAMHGSVVPTVKTYRLYCDDHSLQLYQNQRGNTWVFLTKPGSDNTSYRDMNNKGDQRRQRQKTVDMGVNQDFILSVALDKFSKELQRQMGRVNRQPILAAEVYVISNRDIRSLRLLDLWLTAVDTEETMPLFDNEAKEYSLPKVADVDWSSEPDHYREIVQNRDYSQAVNLQSMEAVFALFQWLLEIDEREILRELFAYLLNLVRTNDTTIDILGCLSAMIDFTAVAPPLAIAFVTSLGDWQNLEDSVYARLVGKAQDLLIALIIAAHEAQLMIVEPFKAILVQMPHMSFSSFAELIRLCSLTMRDQELALDILIESLESQSARLLDGQSDIVRHSVRCLIGVALDHIAEVMEVKSPMDGLAHLKVGDKPRTATCRLRIDDRSFHSLGISDHIRLITATSPSNSLTRRVYSIDAIIKSRDHGEIKLECIHPLPRFLEDCSWKLTHCGSFVTTQTMLDAISRFALEAEEYCPLQESILGIGHPDLHKFSDTDVDIKRHDLNDCQHTALKAAMAYSLICLWGPPGTGKSHTIVSMLQELLASDKEQRILVAAPTHNAADNVMRKYIMRGESLTTQIHPIRVSTDVRKVAEDLRSYTCDAMLGKELNEDFKSQKEARKRIRQSRLIFTTCIGAGLGLLRKEEFSTVIIDEASQQTEPMSLVPLVKGCTKAILVGDHVQLRATVQPLAQLQQFEVSLFECLYNSDGAGIHKVMLDAQYRMHRDICIFSSTEFYNSRLMTAVPDHARPLSESQFPWPPSRHSRTDKARMLFVQCSSPEDIGKKSKSNGGQATLCQTICKRLLAAPISASASQPCEAPKYSIAVLTPYSRQAERLRALLPPTIPVSSIDGFQGREADIIVFVTTRCNVHADMGFLNDLRRLNVVMTRAKSACVVIGDRATLTGGNEEEESVRVWRRLIASLEVVKLAE